MGGWLVPTYQPQVYQRTLRTPVPPVATPVIDHLRVTSRRIEIDCTWHLGAGGMLPSQHCSTGSRATSGRHWPQTAT